MGSPNLPVSSVITLRSMARALQWIMVQGASQSFASAPMTCVEAILRILDVGVGLPAVSLATRLGHAGLVSGVTEGISD